MDRFTKIVVLAWTCGAIALEIELLSSGWPGLQLLAAAVVILMAALGAFRREAVALVLAVSYIFPVIVHGIHQSAPYAPYAVLWMSALVACMMPDLARSSWRIPVRWRAPLVAAVLVIVVTSPMIVLRELDFNWGLIGDRAGWNLVGGNRPSLLITWILHVSVTLVVGVLWFDWLYGATGLDFERFVVTPMMASVALLIGAAIYQMVFDVTFLNQTVYAFLGRASGTMYDANVSGTIAALWLGGIFLRVQRLPRYRGFFTAVTLLAVWLAVWATGSRTAFVLAAVTTVAIGFVMLITRGVSVLQVAQIAGGLALLMVLVVLIGGSSVGVRGPIARFRAALPAPNGPSVVAFAGEMWNRNRYGAVATRMIRDSPLFGTGVGTFQSMGGEYTSEWKPDNAQNWLRHQVAELGFVGSLGWIVWFVMFAGFVFRLRRNDTATTWVTRGMLVGFGLISMLGMPGQDAMVAITFWTIAYWYVSSTTEPDSKTRLPKTAWVAVVAVVIVAAAGTVELAATRFRLPVRALGTDRQFSYGFSSGPPAGAEDGFRAARGHAVAVLDPASEWLSVSVRLDGRVHSPVDVRVWTNGAPLLKGRLTGNQPLTAVVRVPAAPNRVLLEAAARDAGSRRPFFVRSPDSLYLVKWEFLDRPPAIINGYIHPISS